MEIPSGDADVNEPSTLGEIRDRLFVLRIGGVRGGGGRQGIQDPPYVSLICLVTLTVVLSRSIRIHLAFPDHDYGLEPILGPVFPICEL